MRIEVAGAGYLNISLTGPNCCPPSQPYRPRQLLNRQLNLSPAARGKWSSTPANPNKAAHIGHVRNAVLGDTSCGFSKLQANAVEVQNYIDNTGVQVADVVVGFNTSKMTLDQIKSLDRSLSVEFSFFFFFSFFFSLFFFSAFPSV